MDWIRVYATWVRGTSVRTKGVDLNYLTFPLLCLPITSSWHRLNKKVNELEGMRPIETQTALKFYFIF